MQKKCNPNLLNYAPIEGIIKLIKDGKSEEAIKAIESYHAAREVGDEIAQDSLDAIAVILHEMSKEADRAENVGYKIESDVLRAFAIVLKTAVDNAWEP